MSALGRKAKSERRQATARKGKTKWGLPVFFGLLFAWQGFTLSVQVVERAVAKLGAAAFPTAMATLLALLTVTLILVGLGLANRDLARLDWDMDWLLTLPASIPTLYAIKVAESSLVDFFAWFTAYPFLTVLCWYGGWGWWAPLIALLLFLPLLVIIGMAKVVIETTARLFCPTTIMRNLQAMTTVVALLGLFCVMSPAMVSEESNYFLWRLLARVRAWPEWFPLGIPAALALRGAGTAWVRLLVYVSEASLLVALGWWAIVALSRHGAVAGRGLLQGKRGQAASRAKEEARRRLPGGVLGKELRLLLRDRTFLVNTLIVPTVVVGMQVGFSSNVLERMLAGPRHLVALAFGLGAYVLIASATSVLNSEGPALWILYTVPRRLERILLQKALLWSSFGVLFVLAVIVYGATRIGVSVELVGLAAYALIGIPLYALIGAALGVFGSDPLAQETTKRLRLDYLYLFMFLEGLYVYGIYAASPWPRVSMLTLLVALTLSLWQKVGHRVPYILDPVSAPPPTLSLSDGLITALLFFVLQAAFALLTRGALELPVWPAILTAFALAGIVAVVLALYTLWRSKVPHLLRQLGFCRGESWPRTIVAGACWSIPAVAMAVAYTALSRYWPWLAKLVEADAAKSPLGSAGGTVWFGLLVVVAAPLCEETIFRGMIFRGLRSSFTLRLSILASAGIFAVIHPPLSVVPVFVLGACCGLAFDRAKSLLAPITVHALYNLTILLIAYG